VESALEGNRLEERVLQSSVLEESVLKEKQQERCQLFMLFMHYLGR
jgi:hypothetical protein